VKNENQPGGQASRSAGQASRSVGQASRLSEHSWRRHLPHYQLSVGYYFITFSTYNRLILQPSQKDCVFHAIRFFDDKKYELHASVVLDDHVHMIINPTDTLSKIMHSIKSFTAHEINKMSNRKGKVWQDESHDRVIRSEGELLEKINYIANNPIKADLATVYEEYRWLYMKGWINDEL
jgi:REP element-mobilizing transposase RayT